MVVVIGCTLCSYRHDAVVAIFILLKGKFLPKCIVDIHKEVGGIVKSLNGEFRSYFGCQRERFGIVRWNQQYGQCIVGQLTFIRITEEIKSFGAAEFQSSVCKYSYRSICAIDGFGKSYISHFYLNLCDLTCFNLFTSQIRFTYFGLIVLLTCS